MKGGRRSVISASGDHTGTSLTGATHMLSKWRFLVILLVLGEFRISVRSESIDPTSTTMSYKTNSYDSFTSRQHVTPSSKPPDAPSNRLDFISVAVICGVVAFCFIICVIVGCRRKKPRQHLPRCEDVTPTVISPSATETDGPILRSTAGANSSPGALRRYTESPPPTYSVIERQTSFSSYVSQTSSMIEIPPDYEEAWDPDITSGTDISNVSSNRRMRRRPESARENKGPPRVRNAHPRRARSDAEGPRQNRTRPGSRPSTVPEDEALSEFDTTARSIDVIIEVNPSPRSSTALEQSLDESLQPLIVNLDQRSTATSSQV